MRVRSVFFVALALVVGASGFFSLSAGNATEDQVEMIDAQIAQLEDRKRGFESRALKHENYAEYLQFNQRAVLETRRHLQLADENWAKAAQVQQEIDKLQIRRQKLISKGEEPPAPSDKTSLKEPQFSFFIDGDL